MCRGNSVCCTGECDRLSAAFINKGMDKLRVTEVISHQEGHF